MFSIGYAVYLFLVDTMLALLEIQIEGKDGWAKNLPCWRPEKPYSFPVMFYTALMSGRELTGYHVVMFLFVFLILHFPFFTAIGWSGAKELWVISNYFLLFVCWDFLWHVWNPHYGVRKFTPKAISHDYDWLGPIPKDYMVGMAVSLISAFLAEGTSHIIMQWFRFFGVFGGLTLASCLLSLALIKK